MKPFIGTAEVASAAAELSLWRRVARLLNDPNTDQDGELARWRPRALTVLTWVALLSHLPHMLYLVVGPFTEALGPMAWLAAAVFVAVLGLALAPRMNHVLRAWLFLSFESVTTVSLLLRLGFSGMGRTLLIVPPIYALVLLGRRSGLIWAGLSALMYAGVTVLAARGVLEHTLLVQLDSTKAGVWLSGGAGLLTVLVPVSVLLDRFVALLWRVSESERATRQCLEMETWERRLLDVALLETSERERKVLGHELHDGVCQQLTGALLRSQVVLRTLREQQSPEASQVRAVVDLLDESLSQAHELAQGLSPGELPPGALGPALRDLARRVRETHELGCEFQEDGFSGQVAQAAATQLYRIAQEAVTNALKHGKPNQVWIRLVGDRGAVRLEVENDGQSPGTASAAGMGLRIMRGRAEQVGGTLALQSRPEGGALLQCMAPLPDSAEAPRKP